MVRELVRETGFARGISTSVAFLHEGRIASGVRQNTSCVTPTSPRP